MCRIESNRPPRGKLFYVTKLSAKFDVKLLPNGMGKIASCGTRERGIVL